MSGIFGGMEDLNSVPVVGPVEDGQYLVRLQRLVLGQTEDGRRFLRVEADLPDEPTSDGISDLVAMIPDPADQSKQAKRNRSDVRKFMEGFGLLDNWSGIQEELERNKACESVAGAEAVCEVRLNQREGRRPENRIVGFAQ